MTLDWRLRLAHMLKAIRQIETFARSEKDASEAVVLALERAFEILSEPVAIFRRT